MTPLRVHASLATLGIALVVVPLLGGCPVEGDTSADIFREDFEPGCDGVACGWAIVAGEAGSVSIEETFPGERGVVLEAGTAIARTLDVPSSSYWLSYVALATSARCDDGSLLVDVGITTWSGVELVELAPYVTSEWGDTGVSYSYLNEGTSTSSADSFTRIVLRNTGTGRCEVDELALVQLGYGW